MLRPAGDPHHYQEGGRTCKMSAFILGVVERTVPNEASGSACHDGRGQQAGRAVRAGSNKHHESRRRRDVLHHGSACRRLPQRRGRHRGIALPGRDGAGRPRVRRLERPPLPLDRSASEEVHGLAGCNNWAATKFLFAPEQVGPSRWLRTTRSARSRRHAAAIISNTDVRNAEAFALPESWRRFRSSAVFHNELSKQTQGSDIWAGTSLDQLYAKKHGQATPLPSMQFCIENLDQAGGCTRNYSCAYTDSISWASPNEPLPMIRDPRVAFDMLFGAGGTAEERKTRRESRRSILDWISGAVTTMRGQLGAADRTADRYLDNVRELDARIRPSKRTTKSGEPRDIPDAPAGVPVRLRTHQADVRPAGPGPRIGHDSRHVVQDRPRRAESRVPGERIEPAVPPASHHGNREERIMEFNKICKCASARWPTSSRR